VKKVCRDCLGKLDAKGARGRCHKCYERWRYKQDPEKVLKVNRRSYARNRTKAQQQQRKWREANYYLLRDYNRRYAKHNRVKIAQYLKAYRKNNALALRHAYIASKFGLTSTQVEALLKQQKGVCAVCENTETAKGKSTLSIDHDHKTGAVRGLLCTRCNQALGMMKDSPTLLRKAAKYLEREAGKVLQMVA
jgi:hypothetical protein